MRFIFWIFLFLNSINSFDVKALDTFPVSGKVANQYHNDDYTVRIRLPGGQWKSILEYKVIVDLDNPQVASMVYFAIEESVEVAVTKNNGNVREVKIRPTKNNIKSELINNTVYFTLHKPSKLSVEFDGEKLKNLHLFASKPLMKSDFTTPDRNILTFKKGIHVPDDSSNNVFEIPSNTTVFIEGGAILKGKILIENAENIKIIGHGIIDNAERGFEIKYSKNVEIIGPIVRNPDHYSVLCGQSSQIKISDLKAFSARPWSDGIDIMSCNQVDISDVFLRTSDDSIAIYGGRWSYSGDSKNISVKNSILWADVAHTINIGLHGKINPKEEITNVSFKNITVLGHDEDAINYQGAIAISNSDEIFVHDILFENFYIEDIEEGMIFNIRTVKNGNYSKAPGRGIKNVTLKNIFFYGDTIGLNPPVISGYSEQRNVEKITLDGIHVIDKKLNRSDINLGPYIKELVIK